MFDRLKRKLGEVMKPDPGTALQDVAFAVRPHIVKRNDDYVLRYRIRVPEGEQPPLARALVARAGSEKGYYYFSIPVSHPERGQLVERPLAEDGLEDFARKNAVYWLDPDGSEVPLEIREE